MNAPLCSAAQVDQRPSRSPRTQERGKEVLKPLAAPLALGALLLSLPGCGQKPEEPKDIPSAPMLTPPAKAGTTVYLAQAQFTRQVGADGKESPVPGAARLVILTRNADRWREEVLEDPDSNVFHKALAFTPPGGEPGILTIGAVKAQLKLWRRVDGRLVGESLWNPTFGGQFDRLRDLEVGDVTGDKVNDLVIATHDQGVVAVLEFKEGRWQPTELSRSAETFVHEIELGDVDGDGLLDVFATPSRPNKMDGSVQPGEIDRFYYRDGKWNEQRVDTLESRHAKEVLATTLPGETRAVLFASLEGERIGGTGSDGDSIRIRLYRFEGDQASSSDIASLPGKLCRFLTYGDTNGDGKKELVAFTKDAGIYRLEPGADPSTWSQTQIAVGTSGFEHAAYLADINADGRDEMLVASDDQREFRCYYFDGKEYRYETLSALKPSTITWNVTATVGS